MTKKKRQRRKFKQWRAYMCKCKARTRKFCLCGDSVIRSLNRVYFKDLEARNLGALFSPRSPDRIRLPLNTTVRRAIFDYGK